VTGGELLSVMAIGVLFLALVQTTTGMLQGMGKASYPVKTLAVGLVAKILLNYVLIGIPEVNVMGAAYATVACYGISAIGNVLMVLKVSKTRLKVVDALVRPAVAAGAMGVAVGLYAYKMSGVLRNSILTLSAVCVGVAVYVVMAFVMRALTPEELKMIPGGRRLTRLMNKLKGKKA